MSPEEYQRMAERTECNQKASHIRFIANYPIAVRLNHAVLGLAGEVGELAGAVERWLYYGQNLDRINVSEEIGDCLWYIAEACNALGLRMGAVMSANIAKLQSRYPEKFDTTLASEENRDRLKEADIVANGVEDDFWKGVVRTDIEIQDQGDIACASTMATTSAMELSTKLGAMKPDTLYQNSFSEPFTVKKLEGMPKLSAVDPVEAYKKSKLGHCFGASYNRLCMDCEDKLVHDTNKVGLCPDCYGKRMATRQSLLGNDVEATNDKPDGEE